MPTLPTTPPTVSTLSTPPNRATDSATVYANKADTTMSEIPVMVTSQNSLSSWENDTAQEVYDNAVEAATSATNASDYAQVSQSASNFKGRWSDATGAATVPSSYSNNGKTWQLLQDIPDITLDEPSEVASNWQFIGVKDIVNYDRPPTLDDEFDNFALPHWNDKGTLYTGSRIFSNQTSWSKLVEARSSIGDEISVPEAIYSTKLSVSGYAGFCIEVQNSDTLALLDIGFDVNGNVDSKAVATFLGGQLGYVSKWYDQSGNGHHMTSTSGFRPVISKVDYIDGLSIIFESEVIYNGALPATQQLDIPVTLSGDQTALSIIALSSPAHTTRDSPVINLYGTAGADDFALGNRRQNGIDAITAYGNGSPRWIVDQKPNNNFEVWSVASGAGGVDIRANDMAANQGDTAFTAGTFAGGKIGASPLFIDGGASPVVGGFALAYIAIYKRQISIGEYRAAYRSACVDFNLKPQVRGRLIFDGDSICEGAFATEYNSYPKLIKEQLGEVVRYNLVAISGGTSATQLVNQAKWLTQLKSATDKTNTIVYSIGTNDIQTQTAQFIYDNIKLYVTAAKALGYFVVLGTVLPRNGFTAPDEAKRIELNALIKANFATDLGADNIIPWDEERTMGNIANVGNATYYVDGTHPTPYGQTLLAQFGAQKLRLIM